MQAWLRLLCNSCTEEPVRQHVGTLVHTRTAPVAPHLSTRPTAFAFNSTVFEHYVTGVIVAGVLIPILVVKATLAHHRSSRPDCR